MQQKLVLAALVGAFGLSAWAQGVSSPVGVVTISSAALILGVLVVVYGRLESGRPIVPMAFLGIPVVIATLVYFAVGVSTYEVADDKFAFCKEVVQRTIIILLPLYLFSMGPRRLEDVKTSILTLLPACSFVSLVAIVAARAVGFSKPVYVMGLHKNHVAGICAVMGVIAVSCILTSQNLRKRLMFAGFLVIAVLGCVATQGRAGLLCIVISSGFMLVAIKAKPKTILSYVLTVALSGAVLWQILPQEAKEHVVSDKKFSSNQIRVAIWSEVYPMLARDPMRAVGWGQARQEGDAWYGDVANLFLFDWMQMGVIGAIALVVMIGCAVWLPLENAMRMPTGTMLSFVNLVSLGVIVARFTHGMLDTFWIGRGCTLTTWMAIGMAVFVRLLLDQNQAQQQRMSAYTKKSNTARLVKSR